MVTWLNGRAAENGADQADLKPPKEAIEPFHLLTIQSRAASGFRGRAQRPIPCVPYIPWFCPTEESRFKEGMGKQRDNIKNNLNRDGTSITRFPTHLVQD